MDRVDNELQSPFLGILIIIKWPALCQIPPSLVKTSATSILLSQQLYSDTLCLCDVWELAKCYLIHHLIGFDSYDILGGKEDQHLNVHFIDKEVEGQHDENLTKITGPSHSRTGTKCQPFEKKRFHCPVL